VAAQEIFVSGSLYNEGSAVLISGLRARL